MAGNDEEAMAEITRELFDAVTADRSRLQASDPVNGGVVCPGTIPGLVPVLRVLDWVEPVIAQHVSDDDTYRTIVEKVRDGIGVAIWGAWQVGLWTPTPTPRVTQ